MAVGKTEKAQVETDAVAMDLAAQMNSMDVVVHPTVLLSIVDHYTRTAKGTNKRVVGTLTGEVSDGKYHITNCFGVPFEEDTRDPCVFVSFECVFEFWYGLRFVIRAS